MTDSTPKPSENPNQPAPAAGAAPAVPDPVPATKAETPPDPPVAPPAEPPPQPVPPPEPPAVPPVDAIPDKYDIKPPEGVKLDEALIAAMTPAFKELGLTASKAQKLADAFVKVQADSAKRNLASELDRTMKDPDIGQMNWGSTLGHVNTALAAFTTPEDRKWMEQVAGVGNRLEFVRMFARIGRAMASDKPARGSPTSAEPVPTAMKLYGGKDKVGNEKQ